MPGLYIHIPFCKKKCRYCDFVSFGGSIDYTAYIAALISEIRTYKNLVSDRVFDTVFIGGGTPSILLHGTVTAVIAELRKNFTIRPNAEFTIEANPESLTREKLEEYLLAGINRLSIGLQSADDEVLRAIGRVHDRETFLKAFSEARKAGFRNINIDLMHGLPKQDVASYLDSIRLASELGAEHISSYALILEEGTPLYDDVKNGIIILPDEDEVADMEDAGFALLGELGYKRYEISNLSKPTYECKHNLNYWANGEYLGLGLNAHSAMRFKGKWIRWANKDQLSEYVMLSANSKLPVSDTEEVDREEEMFETIMVGLRKVEGVSRQAFMDRFDIDPVTNYASAVSEAVLEGNMEVTETHMKLTPKGMDFQNEVLLKFM